MYINHVTLENIKSYEGRTCIDLVPGVNAITGFNGAGKSTIVEAIGFVLFDTLPFNQKQFTHAGSKKDEVVVSVQSPLDERTYEVVRSAKSSTYYVFDPETQGKLVSGKTDVIDWLKEHFELSNTADLSSLFVNAVGVPQGMITAAFMDTSRNRKTKFDPLLQVEDYQLAYTQLRGSVSLLNRRIDKLNSQIDQLTGRLERFPAIQENIESLTTDIESLETELNTLTEELQAAQEAEASWKELATQIDDLQNRQTQTSNTITHLQEMLGTANSELTRAREAATIVAEHADAYHAHIEAQAVLAELDSQRIERDALKENRQTLVGRAELADQQRQGIEETLENIQQAETQLVELEPLVDKQLEWEAKRDKARTDHATLQALTSQHNEIHVDWEDANERLRKAQAEFESRTSLQLDLDQLQAQHSQLETTIIDLTAQITSQDTKLDELEQALTRLTADDLAACPLCFQPLTEEHTHELFSQYQENIQTLSDERERVIQKRDAHEATRTSVAAQIKELTQRLSTLPSETQIQQLQANVDSLVEKLSKLEAKIAKLGEPAALLDEATTQLETLDDPRAERNNLLQQIADKDEQEDALATVTQEIDDLHEQLDTLDSQLTDYADLDAQLARYTEVQGSTKEAHDQVAAHQQLANQLVSRQEHVDELTTKAQDAADRMADLKSSIMALQAAYDAEAHQDVKDQVAALHDNVTEKQAVLKEKQKNLEKLQKELDELLQTQADLETCQDQVIQQKDLLDTLTYLRETIRDAGPDITRMLVQIISNEADRIFKEIMNDFTYHLRWESDYGIVMTRRGDELEFSQLSGGEKIAAALAVRLALLRETSGIRLAIFDEPTAHLDDERRRTLTSQVTNIHGFDQMIVISHDDTFFEATEHIVRVSNEHGNSLIEGI